MIGDENVNRNAIVERESKTASNFSHAGDDDLYAEIGLRLIVIRREPSQAAQFDLTIDSDKIPKPPRDKLVKMGKRLFVHWNAALYRFLCEDQEEDKGERDRLFSAIVGDRESSGFIAAGILIGSFGMQPALAVVVGPLVVRLLVVPVGKTACEVWKAEVDLR